ncbi:MAG: DUF554 domain-containing protein, partial [Firmicutes bacterium]|nr:DUF554 domain-containing protein [Bacillota bacterium]
TLVNAAAIAAGSIAGLLIKSRLREKYVTTIMHAMGLSVVLVGISGAVKGIAIDGAHSVLFIICLAAGSFIGEAIGIEHLLERLGKFVEAKFKKSEGGIAEGFVSASLLFCVGTMAILGSIESGIMGVHTTLYVKSMLDGITAIVFAATLGFGVILSAVSVFVYQGAITLLSGLLAPYITSALMTEINVVGGILITAIGLNMLGITKIKVGNMLPAIFLPGIYFMISGVL